MRKFTKEISALLASAAMGATAYASAANAATVKDEPAADKPVQTTCATTDFDEGKIGTEMPVTDYDPCDSTDLVGEMMPEDTMMLAETATIGTMVTTTTTTDTTDDWGMIGTTVSFTTPATPDTTMDPWEMMIGTTIFTDEWSMIGTTTSSTTHTTAYDGTGTTEMIGTQIVTDSDSVETIGTVCGEDTAIPPLAGAVQRPGGDINMDGRTNVSDAILLSRVLAEDPTVSVTQEGLDNADMNGSGAPDQEDVVMLLKELAGLN